MLETKLFEIRDSATFIPAIGVNCQASACEGSDHYLLRRAGYGDDVVILLTRLDGGKSTYDAYDWGCRTMNAAHLHIEKEWAHLPSGSVVDVEFILGETTAAKQSEQIEQPL